MTTYSHSRLSTYEKCPLKFKFKYVDELDAEIGEGVEAFLGKRVHESLEKLYKDLKFEKLNTLKELLDFYNSEWEKNWNDDILIVRDEYDQENYRKMGARYISDYYNSYKSFDQEKTIGLEMRVVIRFNGCKIQGFIDRLSFKDGVYFIHDYKTSNSLMSQEEADADRQLALYSIAVKEMFDDCDQVKLVWHYLAFDKEVTSQRTDEQVEELKKEVALLIKEIESCKDYPLKESALCNWCEYRNICPRFRHLYEIEAKEVEEFRDDDGVKLANKYAALKKKEKELCQEIESVKQNIFGFSEQKGIDRIYGSDIAVTIWKKECVKFPGRSDDNYKEFIEVVKEQGLWDDFSTIDKFKLEKAFEKLEISHDKMVALSDYGKKELIKRLYTRERR